MRAFMDAKYFYKSLTLYEEEPYLTNSLSEMAEKGWQLVSKKAFKKTFSHKIILKCKFRKKKLIIKKTEFEIVYRITMIKGGRKLIENKSIIIEAKSSDEAKETLQSENNNIIGFKIDQISKL